MYIIDMGIRMIVRACNETGCAMQDFPRVEHLGDLSLVGFLSIFRDTKIPRKKRRSETCPVMARNVSS